MLSVYQADARFSSLKSAVLSRVARVSSRGFKPLDRIKTRAPSGRFLNLRVNYRINRAESDTNFSNVIKNCRSMGLRDDRIDAK
jgi:hypothetical protein